MLQSGAVHSIISAGFADLSFVRFVTYSDPYARALGSLCA